MDNHDVNRYVDPEFEFSLIPPVGWHFQSSEHVAEMRKRVDIDELKTARMPIFVATKHADVEDDVNPTIQIAFRPIPRPRPESWLQFQSFVNTTFEDLFEDFTVLQEPTFIHIGEIEAVVSRASYTVAYLGDKPLRVLGRSFTVPRGDDMFQIGMAGPLEGDDVCEAEFEETLSSIQFH